MTSMNDVIVEYEKQGMGLKRRIQRKRERSAGNQDVLDDFTLTDDDVFEVWAEVTASYTAAETMERLATYSRHKGAPEEAINAMRALIPVELGGDDDAPHSMERWNEIIGILETSETWQDEVKTIRRNFDDLETELGHPLVEQPQTSANHP